MRIAIGGRIASGKTTAADALVRELEYEKFSLATPLKELAAKIIDWLETQDVFFDPEDPFELKDKKHPKGRAFLQYLGTEAMRGTTLPDLWERVLLHRIGSRENVVVDDLRFRSEAEAFLSAGFLLIKIVTPDDVRLERIDRLYPGVQTTLGHVSETDLDQWEIWDRVFDGGKPLDEFRQEIVSWAHGWSVMA